MAREDNTKKILVPLNDHAFKRMFGEYGCESQLIVLLNGLMNRTGECAIKKLTIIEKEIPREQYADKEIRLDVVAITDEGEQFNIEAQLRNVDTDSRFIFYGARQLTHSVGKGQDYNLMKKVRVITILGSQSKERDKNKGYYKYEKSNEFLERYEFSLPLFENLENKDINNPRHRCLMFLSDKTDDKMRKKVIKMEPEFAKAQETLNHINSSPEEIELYEMRELVKMDIKNAKERDIQEGKELGIEIGIGIGRELVKMDIKNAKERDIQEGKELGIEIGREEEKIEIVLISIKENLPIKTISKITGLSTEEIEKIKKEQEK